MDGDNIFSALLGVGAGLASQSMQNSAQLKALKIQTGLQQSQIVAAPPTIAASTGPLIVVGIIIIAIVIAVQK
jgi:hypothetical protein